MNQDDKKAAAAGAALKYVQAGSVIGVGTGSTVNHFIDQLAAAHITLAGAVSSSEASTQRLTERGIAVIDLNAAPPLDLYVDGADEADGQLCLIKGGGGALTREKIVAAAARKFVCIVDDSKLVTRLGRFPLPVEVVPMAVRLVARALEGLGGSARLRENFTTDNGNAILDVEGLSIDDPRALETTINQLAGVVTVGLFAHRGADILVIATADGVQTRTANPH